MANKLGTIVVREIREALPATIFFLFLLHMIALTRAVSLQEYSLTALRAASATIGALLIAKAVLVVEALPIARLPGASRAAEVLWKTLLYGVVVLVFKVLEEGIPLAWKHGGVVSAARALTGEISWPLVAVLSLWIAGGLLLYCLATELVRAIGSDRVKALLLGGRSGTSSD